MLLTASMHAPLKDTSAMVRGQQKAMQHEGNSSHQGTSSRSDARVLEAERLRRPSDNLVRTGIVVWRGVSGPSQLASINN